MCCTFSVFQRLGHHPLRKSTEKPTPTSAATSLKTSPRGEPPPTTAPEILSQRARSPPVLLPRSDTISAMFASTEMLTEPTLLLAI
jgi:hypothetical protein